MANDYTLKEKGIIRADATKIYPSVDAMYGPWASIAAFRTYLGEILGGTVTDDIIPNSVEIGIIQEDGTVKRYEWQKPTNGQGSWVESGGGAVASVNGKTGVVVLDKTDIGLGNVDNTSDVNKPISTATQTALNAKANASDLTAHTGSTSNPHGVTKAQVGLGNVDNTADADKIVKRATEDGSGNVITSTYETKTDAQSKITELAEDVADTYQTKTDAASAHSNIQGQVTTLSNTVANLTGLDGTNFGGFSIQQSDALAVAGITTLFSQMGYTAGDTYWFLAGTSMASLKAYRFDGVQSDPVLISNDVYDFTDFSGLQTKVDKFKGTTNDIDSLNSGADVGIYFYISASKMGLVSVGYDATHSVVTQHWLSDMTPDSADPAVLNEGPAILMRSYKNSAWSAWKNPIGELAAQVAAFGPKISGVFASDSAVFASYRWVDVSALNLAIGDYIVVTNKSDTYKVYLRFAQADKTLLDSGNTTINVGESLLIKIAYANVGQLRFGGNMSASGQTAPFEVVYGGLDYLMSVAKQNETLRNGISTNVSNLNTVVDGVFASGQTQNAAYTWVDVSSLNLAVGDYLVIKNKSNDYNITLRFAKSDNTLIGATQSVASGTSALIKIVDENVAKLRFSANTSASGQSAAFDIISGGVSYLQRVVANKAESGDALNKKEIVFDVGAGTDLVAAFADEMVNSIPNYNNGKRQDNSTYQASGYIGVTEGTVIYVKHTNNQYIAPLACYSELPTNANEEEAYYMKSASIVGTGTAYDGNFTIPAGVKYVVMTYNPAFAAISQIIYTFISGRCYRIGSVAANLLNTSVVKTIAQTLPSATQQVVRNNIDAANAQDAVALKRPQFYARNIVSALQYKGECAIAKSYPLHWIDVMQRLNDRYAFGYSELAQNFTIPALNGYVDVEVTDASMFSNGKFIGIGTLDYYDVYIVMSITDNSMHLAKKQDNMGMAGETMSVTTELNRISGGASHLAKTMVFLTDDLKSYEANEMPFSLKGGDTVHPNATGFQYVADIIKESVLTRYPNVTRVIAFGDSWTAMPQAWPYYFNVTGVSVERTTTAKSGYRIEQIMDLFATYMQTYTPQTGDVFVFLMGTNNLFDIYRKYATQEEVTPMQFMHDKNYVRTLRKACDTISQALPYGNWFIGGGHAICWSWGTNKDTDWA